MRLGRFVPHCGGIACKAELLLSKQFPDPGGHSLDPGDSSSSFGKQDDPGAPNDLGFQFVASGWGKS